MNGVLFAGWGGVQSVSLVLLFVLRTYRLGRSVLQGDWTVGDWRSMELFIQQSYCQWDHMIICTT